ncbi:Rpn family recombination-promoting nuclease/putative transposase [Lederbergia citrea]|uniref:Rpn family recombination-promoting nuclease/putative transposase n=1 Tax=Lederbergia citrea TaxID=2833581 RepID=UPI001BCA2D24|nr:Rpn family recombination-promoting nuclease/putative transposase [Lederbergia citrea]MBS4204849.1 Rpn family recombination-promoting nuclease/putative transposase [Lederbergia citrea]
MSLTMFVREDSTQYIHHDQLFKQLIHTFFAEFLEVFFPEVHEHIDFTSIKPLSEEMFTDLLEGESRRADIIIETKLKGQDTVIIIHVEPQSYSQPSFHERMYHYFSLLYNKYRKPILPIAIFSYDENRYESNEFTIEFPFFHVFTFQFLMLELRKMNWRDYIHSNNPVAAALLSKMGYTDKEKVQVKIEFMRMLFKMEIDPAKAELINGFFEMYLRLNEREELQLMKEIKQLDRDEADFISKLPNSWKEKGLQEGLQKGKTEEKRKIALEMLREGLTIDLIIRITNLSREEIDHLRKKL